MLHFSQKSVPSKYHQGWIGLSPLENRQKQGCFGDRGGKKMKKVLNKVPENYHKGIKSQILAFLSDSEARSTAEIVSHVDGARQKVNSALSELVKAGEIEKVKRGVYRGSPGASSINETKDAPLIIIFY